MNIPLQALDKSKMYMVTVYDCGVKEMQNIADTFKEKGLDCIVVNGNIKVSEINEKLKNILENVNYCSDCKYYKDMPTGVHCQKCDNGSKWKGRKG